MELHYKFSILYISVCSDKCQGTCDDVVGCNLCQPGFLYPDCINGKLYVLRKHTSNMYLRFLKTTPFIAVAQTNSYMGLYHYRM